MKCEQIGFSLGKRLTGQSKLPHDVIFPEQVFLGERRYRDDNYM